MKAAAPNGHKYQLGRWVQRHFPLDQWLAETVLSFSKDAHRTWPGVIAGHWLFSFVRWCGKEKSEGEKQTNLKRSVFGKSWHWLVCSFYIVRDLVFRTYFEWKAVDCVLLLCFSWLYPRLPGQLPKLPALTKEKELPYWPFVYHLSDLSDRRFLLWFISLTNFSRNICSPLTSSVQLTQSRRSRYKSCLLCAWPSS